MAYYASVFVNLEGLKSWPFSPRFAKHWDHKRQLECVGISNLLSIHNQSIVVSISASIPLKYVRI